jgi:YD repeat-containing protein
MNSITTIARSILLPSELRVESWTLSVGRSLAASAGILLIVSTLPPAFAQSNAYEGPVGVTGIFNGNITTGCSYDPMTHSAKRTVNDIVVPGSVGKYPLKMTRYYNSRSQDGWLGPGWFHEYGWLLTAGGDKLISPQGNVYEYRCENPVGISEGWEGGHPPDGQNGTTVGTGTFRLADGGEVHFDNFRLTYINDPHGLRTTITPDTLNRIGKVIEPGGRYLQFIYDSSGMLTTVEAHDGRGNTTDSVNYSYTSVPSGGIHFGPSNMLTGVVYSDGTSATYHYLGDNTPDNPGPPLYTARMYPVMDTCNDVRYSGPMRQITYEYVDGGPHGVIRREKNPNVGPISSIAPDLAIAGTTTYDPPTSYTETRGDGPSRTFTYTRLRSLRNTEGGTCPDYIDDPHQQMLTQYTDFHNHTAYLGYDANLYVNSVTDFNGHITNYTHGSAPPAGIGEIMRITHPGGSHIDYTYYDGGHYVQQITNERGAITYYTRDANNRITRIDYKDASNNVLAFEEFTAYNNFGQVLTYHLKNGAWKSFVYDTNNRGLLTDEYNPKATAPGGNDPRTHYDYYTAADGNLGWIDRLKKVTLPLNGSNLAASETYEYDRAYDQYRVTNLSGAAVGGRGLVTKIMHANLKYQTFKYDWYGNKVWQDNERRKITSYSYDAYNRLLSVTDPLIKTTQYDYAPTQGNITQAQQHTSNSARWVTAPSAS